ncbi:MAG: ribonucleoside triphosphate reductase [Planctomycetota bacterium]|jgi:ribonucleoside-triphosphate reductase
MNDYNFDWSYDAMKDNFDLIQTYLDRADWRVKENANFSYSWSGLQSYVVDHIMANFSLANMPTDASQAHKSGDIHIHNLNSGIIPYCHGGDLLHILSGGIRSASIRSKPAKHLDTAIDHITNYLFMSQLEFAGAQAVSDINTLLAPFIYYDGLSRHEVYQAVQRLVFDLNFESRQAFQTPFTNISVNNGCPEYFANMPVLIGGEQKDRTYGDFQEESDIFLEELCNVLLSRDPDGRPFTFPIPTLNVTKRTDFDSPVMQRVAKVSGELGSFYFMNYMGSGINEHTVRAMCCRLMLDLDDLPPTSGLWNFSGGTGSLGVVSLNMSRLGYEAEGIGDLFERLDDLINVAVGYLLFKDAQIRKSLDNGLLPFSKYYGLNLDRYFRTIGVIGLNELCENYLGCSIIGKDASTLIHDILMYLRNRTQELQRNTKLLWNLEMTPGEGSSYRLARKDKERYSGIHTLGTKYAPYYTTLLVPSLYDVPMAKLELEEHLLPLFTGGTVSRNFIGEVLNSGAVTTFLKFMSSRKIPYFDLTATFGVCNECHTFIRGKGSCCPVCQSDSIDTYSRVVGYYRAVKKWNIGKRQEFTDRTYMRVNGQDVPIEKTVLTTPIIETRV